MMKVHNQNLKQNTLCKDSRYIENVLKLNNNIFSKATTCWWTLQENNPDFRLYQYFVLIDLKFALNLSSYEVGPNKGIGATFMSATFAHSTSIPIWIDNKEKFNLKVHSNMYNFAWVSNGSCKERI